MKTLGNLFLIVFFQIGLILGINFIISHRSNSNNPGGERENQGFSEDPKAPRRQPKKQKFRRI